MSARIKYEIEGVKVPSLNSILDNCKIGGIGNLLYRANQAGLAGLQLKNASEDTINAGWLAFKRIDNLLNCNDFDIDLYSDACIDRSEKCFYDFKKWSAEVGLSDDKTSLSLVSESLRYGAKFDIYSTKNDSCVLIMLLIQNNIYPENLIKLAAHANLLEENKIVDSVKSSIILRVNNPKTLDDPATFSVHEYNDLHYPFQTFKKMRELYDMQDTIKTLV